MIRSQAADKAPAAPFSKDYWGALGGRLNVQEYASPAAFGRRLASEPFSTARVLAPWRIALYNHDMGFLSARDEEAVMREFQKLTGPVTLTVFASELGPENNAQTVSLIKEVAALSEQITVKVLNPHIERDEALAYGVSVAPAIAVEGAKDYGIRFLGTPAGYEFSNLIDSIIAVSTGEAQLKDETKVALAGLTEDVTIKVFATPT